ncbi:unnamed protein product [Lactuca saligna]|uniref:Retrotransposon Copia-like N-terminal domain-containing protein n=1 Tax=Lactuca saligna TaxID=75948 RepID=A0AA35VSL3_LACSI|nr:unnamed protein product [Lactuca saligna]
MDTDLVPRDEIELLTRYLVDSLRNDGFRKIADKFVKEANIEDRRNKHLADVFVKREETDAKQPHELGSAHTTPENSPPPSPKHMGANDDTSFSLIVNTTLKDITIVNFPTTLKLTSTNYLGWKTEIEALLHGLDLYRFIDDSHLASAPTIAADGTSTPIQTIRSDSGKTDFFSVP